MGSLFRPKYGPKDARKESEVWWLKYRAAGRIVRESSGTRHKDEARRLLKVREGMAEEGRAIIPRADRLALGELFDDLKHDYQANARRAADRLDISLNHLRPFFGSSRAARVTTADITTYITKRCAYGSSVAPACGAGG